MYYNTSFPEHRQVSNYENFVLWVLHNWQNKNLMKKHSSEYKK